MKVLLVDVDSKIPNIVLGKLSTYHKSLGDTVSHMRLHLSYFPHRNKKVHYINTKHYDKVYCSVVFEGTLDYVNGKNMIIGGTGTNDFSIVLPEEIENGEVDYTLWPENDASYGFISRGCIRNCYFCKVPKKEGMLHQVNTLDKIVRHKKVMFLDNNILALPNHMEILTEIRDRKIECDLNQGLDMRLVTPESAKLLFELNYWGKRTFALDDINTLPMVEKKVKDCFGFAGKWQLRFYVYVSAKMEHSNFIRRLDWIQKNHWLPYVMRDLNCYTHELNDFYSDISNWANTPQLFAEVDFPTYMKVKHSATRPDRVKKHTDLYINNR